MTNALLLQGPLGSGKTTTIKDILKNIRQTPETESMRVMLITNDPDKLNVDRSFIDGADDSIELTGCICCAEKRQLGEELRKIAKDGSTDLVIIEATGQAGNIEIPDEIFGSAGGIRKLALVDVLNYETNLNMQMDLRVSKGADTILLTKDGGDVGSVLEEIALFSPDANVVRLPKEGERREEIIDKIVKGEVIESEFQIDPSIKSTDQKQREGHNIYTFASNLIPEITIDDIREVIELTRTIFRAKGVLQDDTGNWVSWNYVAGDMEVTPVIDTGYRVPMASFFSNEPIIQGFLEYYKVFNPNLIEPMPRNEISGYEKSISYLERKITELESSQENDYSEEYVKLKNLLIQYVEYLQETISLRKLETERTNRANKLIFGGTETDQSVLEDPEVKAKDQEIKEVKNTLSEVGDSMKFDTPIVWVLYKYFAYQETENAILKVSGFRRHCKQRDDYICSKRYKFLRRELLKKSGADLDSIDPKKDLLEIIEMILPVVQDESFMEEWRKYEYFEDERRVAKWENYED